ncbi:MAG: hypothetical protein MUC99_10030, partial [Anaerolineae bacterium]|nr:hypothetical protein [Anaerolineae bacterium]
SDPNAWAMWVDGHGLTDVGRGFVPDPKHDDLDTVAAYRAHPHHGRIVSVGDDEALGWLRHRLGGLLELTEHQGGRMTCLHGMA